MRNTRGKIQAKCPFGRQYGGECQQQLHKTEIWTIVDRLEYKFVYVPVLKCILHKKRNISFIYGNRNEKETFKLGPFDELVPNFKFYTMISWQTKTGTGGQMKNRYHFSEECLERLVDSILIERYVVFVLYLHCICIVF